MTDQVDAELMMDLVADGLAPPGAPKPTKRSKRCRPRSSHWSDVTKKKAAPKKSKTEKKVIQEESATTPPIEKCPDSPIRGQKRRATITRFSLITSSEEPPMKRRRLLFEDREASRMTTTTTTHVEDRARYISLPARPLVAYPPSPVKSPSSKSSAPIMTPDETSRVIGELIQLTENNLSRLRDLYSQVQGEDWSSSLSPQHSEEANLPIDVVGIDPLDSMSSGWSSSPSWHPEPDSSSL